MSDDLRDIVVLIDGREHVLKMPAHDPLPDHPVLGTPYGGRDMMLYVPRDGNGVYAWKGEKKRR